MEKQATNRWKTIAIILGCLLLAVCTLYGMKIGFPGKDNAGEQSEEEISWLSLWKDDAQAKVWLEACKERNSIPLYTKKH